MKVNFTSLRPAVYLDRSTSALFRLCTAFLLYVCFGLLAQYAYADTAGADLQDPVQGGVWLIPEGGTRTDALLLETDVNIHVSGMITRATVTQRFRNTSNDWAEGIYVFPLPDNAAVDHFSLHAGGRILEGQIQERAQAKRNYQSARNEGKHASLVEQQRANVFTTSLANIAPGEELRIIIEYQQTLEYKDGSYRLRFPMVVGPRYQAATVSASPDDEDTDISTLVSDTKTNPVHLQVTLDAGVPLAKLDSTYHAINIRQIETDRYSIALSQGQVYADRDFELVWRPELDHQPQTVVFSENHGDYQYALLSILPPDLQLLGQTLLPREVIFILDVSGSMSGTPIKQARASLIQALSRLKPEDRFNIIWFNDRTERLYPQAVPAKRESIQQASVVINSLAANGGTVMLPALALALSEQPGMSHVRQIVFLTDGNVDNERELFGLIKQQLGENRLFTVGIGSAPNSYFMRKAARAGRGTFTHIGDIDEVQQKTDLLLQKLEAPALVNIDLEIDGVAIEVFPDPVPDLYLGDSLAVLVRGKQIDDLATVYANYGDSIWQQQITLSNQVNHPGIHTTWARSKIASLLEQAHDAGTETAREAIRKEIVQTAIDHHLVSRHTSLVAVDVTPVNSSGTLHTEKIKTNLPHGWKAGEQQPAGPQLLLAQLNLPQTATSAFLHVMIASMLFALAMLFWSWKKLL